MYQDYVKKLFVTFHVSNDEKNALLGYAKVVDDGKMSADRMSHAMTSRISHKEATLTDDEKLVWALFINVLETDNPFVCA